MFNSYVQAIDTDGTMYILDVDSLLNAVQVSFIHTIPMRIYCLVRLYMMHLTITNQ